MSNSDEPEIVTIDENTELKCKDSTTPLKGLKRNALSPLEAEVKKIKTSDANSEKTEAGSTPKGPKTPKISKEERERLRLLKLEEKEKQRAERERALEEKRLEKERILEEKRLEKEKKEKERLEKKAEEERKKEERKREIEEKRKREEEEQLKKKKEIEEKKEAKRREEEAKRKEEEAIEEKKRRESARFLGFFNKIEKKKTSTTEPESSTWYRPFEIKDGMTLAPMLPRKPLSVDVNILKHMDEVSKLTYLKSENVEKRKIVPSRRVQMRAKLFQFHDNHRPPFYGTWRKLPKSISGRRPFAHEPGLDYEIDSDEEWEDEPSDGEECRSDDEDEVEDDVEDDDGFFVPPCYLSDGEGEDGSDVGEDDEDEELKKQRKKEKRVCIDSDDEEVGVAAAAGETCSTLPDDVPLKNGVENPEERKARLASRAKEWSRRVSRRGQLSLDSRCIGPCYDICSGSSLDQANSSCLILMGTKISPANAEVLGEMRAVLF